MTPTIEGLTQRQRAIADLLWSCNSQESVMQLLKGLPTDQDRLDASCLVRMMIHEVAEQEGHLDGYKSQALAVIDSARGH